MVPNKKNWNKVVALVEIYNFYRKFISIRVFIYISYEFLKLNCSGKENSIWWTRDKFATAHLQPVHPVIAISFDGSGIDMQIFKLDVYFKIH